jgi:uncharacterized membrane protein YhhN
MVVFFPVAVLLVIGFIGLELKRKWLLAIFAKGIASFGFLLVALIAIADRMIGGITMITRLDIRISILFVAGLIAGLLGDLTLALRPLRPENENRTIIFSGIVCFSIGHLFYLAALVLVGGFELIAIPFAIGVTGLVYLMSKVMKFAMGRLTIPTFVYSFLIFLMVGQAIFMAPTFASPEFQTIVAIGAVLFGISDLILAPIYFKGEKSPLFIASNLATYYAAQLLLAISLLFL